MVLPHYSAEGLWLVFYAQTQRKEFRLEKDGDSLTEKREWIEGKSRSRDAGLWDHLSCSRCASWSGWGAAGVRRAPLLWRNLTRPRKSSAAYSTQRSGLISSRAFPVNKSHPSATQGREKPRQQATVSPLPPAPPLPEKLLLLLEHRTARSLCRAAALSGVSCLSLVQKHKLLPLSLSLFLCLFSPNSPRLSAGRLGEMWSAVARGMDETARCVPSTTQRHECETEGGSELHLHVNQQLRGPQVTEIEQWPALAKNRSGKAQGLEQHWCV